ncbi:peptide/nickel transport system ATP-binding protein [Pseudorhodobacter antarcticus]|jgi:peptide/nickel transport system ATP-binding protein|uniref:Peptide/nickel transport system ATP-binding protein n=1 Tax=Pseudorhodobacter antarcticus TaxID=1077947 RepID=A0A1H8GI27_9RHOB|nr:oligopeptide/dipeptide ABC transporter ATP-binding protein [Pseudorhodobacter antarcticus]SEN43633.1 peptide/nickel transport system ATP-binding protein [Pseudorhodobacter antarcticus]
MTNPILRIENVSKRFTRMPGLAERLVGRLTGGGKPVVVHALTDVSLEVAQGEVLGIVGESGCGKSTLGRVVAGIYAPSDGRVTLHGKPIAREHSGNIDKLTTQVQMIHQDPFASLNPRMKVGETLAEGPRYHKIIPSRDVQARMRALLEKVGLEGAYADRFPHQFSGGQRQRVAIARALAMEPEVLVLDEAVASLDVSIQAQVLNLFMDLRRDLGLTALFISHDLSVVRHVCDRVAIMYLGRLVELAPADQLYADPKHPYTSALFASVPTVGTGKRVFEAIKGEIPSPINPPPGCAFHPRCPLAGPRCRMEVPRLTWAGVGRQVACHLNDGGVDSKGAPA